MQNNKICVLIKRDPDCTSTIDIYLLDKVVFSTYGLGLCLKYMQVMVYYIRQ